MPDRGIVRAASQRGYATPTNAPIRVDPTSSRLFINPTGSGTTEIEISTINGKTPAAITAATATLGAANKDRITYLNRAAGIALTLPAATGSGDTYPLVVGATFTGAASVAVANAQDYMVGLALLDKVGTVSGFPTANTGTVATESDTFSMFGTANAQGGIKGAYYEIRDVAANVWAVQLRSEAGGTVATPFSVAV